MRYFVTNAKGNPDVDNGQISVKGGETKEFKQSDALYLVKTFGFLTLETKEGKEFEEKKEAPKKKKSSSKKK